MEFAHTAFTDSLGGNKLSPYTWTLTCAAIQPDVALVCPLNSPLSKVSHR